MMRPMASMDKGDAALAAGGVLATALFAGYFVDSPNPVPRQDMEPGCQRAIICG